MTTPFIHRNLPRLLLQARESVMAHTRPGLREHGLSEVWVIAIPASIGAFQVLGRLLLYFFEHHFDLHLANRLIPALIPLGLLALLAAPWAGPAQTGVVVLFVVLFGIAVIFLLTDFPVSSNNSCIPPFR